MLDTEKELAAIRMLDSDKRAVALVKLGVQIAQATGEFYMEGMKDLLPEEYEIIRLHMAVLNKILETQFNKLGENNGPSQS